MSARTDALKEISLIDHSFFNQQSTITIEATTFFSPIAPFTMEVSYPKSALPHISDMDFNTDMTAMDSMDMDMDIDLGLIDHGELSRFVRRAFNTAQAS